MKRLSNYQPTRERTTRVTTHLLPDVLQLVQQHATKNGLTMSGAIHDLLRTLFRLK